MRTAIVTLGALLAPLLVRAELLVVPDAPAGAPPRLARDVVPALRASAPPGWEVRAVAHHPAPPDAVPEADAALWAELRDGAIVLHLYRRASDRVVTLPLGLPGDSPAPPAAVRDAVRLQVEYLFQSRGGAPWSQAVGRPPPPPLPPPPPPVPPDRVADLELAPPRLPPPREPAVVPAVPPPVTRTLVGGTRVEVARRGDAPDAVHAGGLVGVPTAPPAPPSRAPTRLGLGVGLRADGENVGPTATLDFGLRLGAPWLEIEVALLPAGVDGAVALRTALGLTLPLWDAAVGGALAAHLAYEGLPAVGAADAHRGAADLGLRLAARLSLRSALALTVAAVASPSALRDDDGVTTHGHLGVAAGLAWVLHFAEPAETAPGAPGSEGRTGYGGATAWEPGSW